MAASAIIASGTTAVDSADFTLAAGVPATISLFAAAGRFGNDVSAQVFKKSSGGLYRALKGGDLNSQKPVVVIDGPGEYRVSKLASTAAFGVDRD